MDRFEYSILGAINLTMTKKRPPKIREDKKIPNCSISSARDSFEMLFRQKRGTRKRKIRSEQNSKKKNAAELLRERGPREREREREREKERKRERKRERVRESEK